jgi:hypothetical protein
MEAKRLFRRLSLRAGAAFVCSCVGALLIGCGLTNGHSTTAMSTEARFTSDVNRVCAGIAEDARAAAGPTDTYVVVAAEIRIQTQALASLNGLRAPVSLSNPYREFVRALTRRTEYERDYLAALRANAQPGYDAAERAMNQQLRVARRAAKRLRMSGCPFL